MRCSYYTKTHSRLKCVFINQTYTMHPPKIISIKIYESVFVYLKVSQSHYRRNHITSHHRHRDAYDEKHAFAPLPHAKKSTHKHAHKKTAIPILCKAVKM